MNDFHPRSFDELMKDAFQESTAMSEFNEAADEAEELIRKFESTLLTTDPRGPHYLEDIADIQGEVVSGFYEQLVDDGIQVDSIDELTARDYALLADIAALETANMHTLLPRSEPGAPVFIQISSAPYIDTAQIAKEDDGLVVQVMPDGCLLHGEYHGFVPMPAPTFDAYSAGLQGDFATHVAIGAVLKNAVMVTGDGERIAVGNNEGQIVVALTLPQSRMMRVRYQCDELFTTPPEDPSD